MFDVLASAVRHCDGVTRRHFLRVGGLVLGGAGLADLLRHKALAAASGKSAANKAVIQIWLGGGPSHIDMYDLKPQAPVEFRGEFREIATNVPGIRICEHLPLQAAVMDKLAVVRSAFHTTAGHGPGSHWMLTGYEAPVTIGNNKYPSCGSVVARVRGPNAPGMPAYVGVPKQTSFGGAAYLGAAYGPFTPEDDPNDRKFAVRNLQLTRGLTLDRLTERGTLLRQLDTLRRDIDTRGELAGLDQFNQQALQLLTSDKATQAFDLSREEAALRDRYGRTTIGQGCLLARRLVEAGVSYVTVLSGGAWDTHANNFEELKNVSLPRYDRAVATLVSDLCDRGLDRDVLVLASGEFGRTPRVNAKAGRDHWPGAMAVLFAGGGLKMGQMVGTTDSRAARPTSKPATPGCILSTMYHTLGIDYHQVLHDRSGRPTPILSEGRPIADLIG